LTRGLYTSASGMLALQVALDATANNLANVATVGYKKDRAVYHDFRDLLISRLYDTPEGPVLPVPLGAQPIGRLGTGVYVEDITTDFAAQGPLQQTGGDLDVALVGSGFLVVRTPSGERYTRAGQLVRDAQGVLTNDDGHPVLGENGPIRLSAGTPTSEVRIAENGEVFEGDQRIGRLRVEDLLPGAVKEGYTLVRGSSTGQASGSTVLEQGYLEGSTVNGVRETVELIQIERAYQAGQRSIEAVDDSLGRLFEKVAG